MSFPYSKLLVCFFFAFSAFAQTTPPKRSIFVKKNAKPIVIDGVMNEEAWSQAEVITDFWQFFPTDSLKSKNKTEIRFVYDDQHMHVGIRAESKTGKFIVNSLRRDFGGSTNDNVSLIFDTFNDGTNAYMFSVNPYGVQREALISGGGSSQLEALNPTWDVKWQSEGKIDGNQYVIEMAIPFSSIKFKEGSQSWRFQAYRWDLQTNEQSAWSRVPQNQLLVNLAFLGELIFEKPLGKNHPPMYIIPYVNALTGKDYVNPSTSNSFTYGLDAKVPVGNGLNLDITANPDFSNVEADNLVTNLTRFEISMPEKRQFFIDNNDLFGSFGSTYNDAKPFFSRRIGIVTDPNGRTIENRILGGVRLSGKLDHNWRLGVLNLQTASDEGNKIASNNNAMFSLQRKLFARSNIGFFFLNRETFGNYDFLSETNRFNRVIGLDYNLATKDNKWTGKLYLHKSFQPGDFNGNLSSQAVLSYNTRFYNLLSDWVYVDKDFKSDLGFIPRKDILKSGTGIGRTYYFNSGILNKHTPRLMNLLFFKPSDNLRRTDQLVWLMDDIEFKNQALLSLRYMYNYTYLTNGFDPTRTEGAIPLPGSQDYVYHQGSISFSSKNSSMITFTGMLTAGQFFNGRNVSLASTVNLRIMPKALITLITNYDHIELPKPYASADILLVSPKVDLTFSKSFFWSTLIQFSNQRKNLGINSRIQWRFAPLSDLYLVYNDNFQTQDFMPTYRSINLKLSYWLNL